MRAKIAVAGLSIAALLGAAACTTTDPYSSTPRRNNTGTGAVAGALGGALLGYLTNTSSGEQGRKNALIGAGIGWEASAFSDGWLPPYIADGTGPGSFSVPVDVGELPPGDYYGSVDISSDNGDYVSVPVLLQITEGDPPTATPTTEPQTYRITFENMSRDGLRFAYVITNTASTQANVVHSFSANGISTDYQMNAVIPAAGSQAVVLPTLPLPTGWQGTVFILADQPITGTVAIRSATPTPTTAPTNTPTATPTTTTGGSPTLYWINNTTRTIQRLLPGGGFSNLLPFDSGQSGNNIRVDRDNGKLYWAESRTVKRANLDGSGVETLATVAEVMGNVFPDAAHGKVYYVRRYAGLEDDLRRKNLDGTGDEFLFTFHPTTNLAVTDIWIDGANGQIYWTNSNGTASIERANLDGSGRQTVVASAGTNPMRMQLDLGNGKIYWTDNNMSTSIQRANLDGTGKQVLVTGVNVPSGFDLDLANGRMYWADGVQGGLIQSANLDGTGRATLFGPLGVSSFTDLPGLAVGLPAGSVTPTATPTATPTGTSEPPTPTHTATATTQPPTPTHTPTATTEPPTPTHTPTATPTTAVALDYLQLFSITPDEGVQGSATNVTIAGAGFNGVTAVWLGGAPITNYNVINDQQMTAVVPASLPYGWHDLYVNGANGDFALLAQAFLVYANTPVVDQVAPAEGLAEAPTTLHIYGFNFAANAAAYLMQGSTVVTMPTTFVDENLLVADLPGGIQPGVYDLAVDFGGNGSATRTGRAGRPGIARSATEAVLPFAQGSESLGPPGLGRQTTDGLQGGAHLRLVGSQERVEQPLCGQGRGQRGLSARAKRRDRLDPPHHVAIAGLGRRGERQVREGVLVTATHQGRIRQGPQSIQRLQHLRRGAFEQAAAAGAEQGVAAEQQAVPDVGDMAQRVSRHLQDGEGQADFRQPDGIAFGDDAVDRRKARVGRAVHPGRRKGAPQSVDATDVVAMVVGDEDGGQRRAEPVQACQDRLGPAGIDRHRAPAVDQQPDVVVLQDGHGVQPRWRAGDQWHRFRSAAQFGLARIAGLAGE